PFYLITFPFSILFLCLRTTSEVGFVPISCYRQVLLSIHSYNLPFFLFINLFVLDIEKVSVVNPTSGLVQFIGQELNTFDIIINRKTTEDAVTVEDMKLSVKKEGKVLKVSIELEEDVSSMSNRINGNGWLPFIVSNIFILYIISTF